MKVSLCVFLYCLALKLHEFMLSDGNGQGTPLVQEEENPEWKLSEVLHSSNVLCCQGPPVTPNQFVSSCNLGSHLSMDTPSIKKRLVGYGQRKCLKLSANAHSITTMSVTTSCELDYVHSFQAPAIAWTWQSCWWWTFCVSHNTHSLLMKWLQCWKLRGCRVDWQWPDFKSS